MMRVHCNRAPPPQRLLPPPSQVLAPALPWDDELPLLSSLWSPPFQCSLAERQAVGSSAARSGIGQIICGWWTFDAQQ
eukprot:8920563-Alexandrium_andersonii.AAC.1